MLITLVCRIGTITPRPIFDATSINDMENRNPPTFKLPALKGLLGSLVVQRERQKAGKIYLAKLDQHNALWCIRLPRKWQRIFVLLGVGRGR